MRKPRIKPFTLVTVVWHDAYSDGATNYDTVEDAIASFEPRIRRTIGFFVGYAAERGHSVIITAIDDDRRDEAPEGLGSLTYTPWGMVLDVEIMPTKESNADSLPAE